MHSSYIIMSIITLALGTYVRASDTNIIGGCIGTMFGCCNETIVPCLDFSCSNCNLTDTAMINHTDYENFRNLSGFGYVTGYGAFENLTFYGYLMNLTGLGNITGSNDFHVVSGFKNVTNMTGLSHLDVYGRFSNLTGVGFFPNITGIGNLTTIGSFFNNTRPYAFDSIVDIFF